MLEYLAPNRKPSNLTPEQYKLVRTPAFKKWFGDWENDPENASKVVDENGEPMVVWHTTNNEFNKFDKRKSREGFFFSPQKNRLVVYNKSKINSYFLNLRNPSHEIFKLDLKYLKPKGYDGIMDYGHDKKSGNENLYEIIAFEPNQIKLADGTNTAFDVNNPDIRFKEGGLIAPNGKPSNLTPQQYELVRSDAFKNWFGDWENDPENASKVIDENGEPKVMYRGNRKSQEDLGYEYVLGHNFLNKENPNNFGFFFTDDIDVAKKYGGRITQVFLNVKNLFDLTELGIITDGNNFIKNLETKGISFKGYEKLKLDILEYDRTYDKIDNKQWHTPNIYDFFDIFPELKYFFQYRDYNAVVFKETSRSYFPYLTYAIFEPNQIKLADGTNTTFDGSNPDIRYAGGGELPKTSKDENGNWSGEYLGHKFTLYNISEGWYFSIYFYSAIMDNQEIYQSNKDYIPFRTKKDALNSIIEKIIEINSDNEDFNKKRQSNNPDIRFEKGGSVIINPTEIECHKCHWKWKVKDGGDDLFICHKCYTDNTKFYKFEGLAGEKILNTNIYEIGGIFQGTPHDFNKYSTEFIGTGEGLQAFGWGLYFTNIKDIAKNYAKNELLIQKEISRKSENSAHLWIYTNISDNVVDKLGYLKTKLKEFEELKKEYKKDTWDDKIETYSTLIDIVQNYQGKIYSVTLFKGGKETDYDLIKWEKSLSVDNLIKIFTESEKIGGIDFKDGWEVDEKFGLTNERANKVTGEEMYRWLSTQLDGDKEASLFLLRAGIDGIKYKAGSLSGMEDADGYNYVIFDGDNVTIESKEKFDNGGDIQAYEDAMGISKFKKGGEEKPKKVYVSIRLDNELKKIPKTFNEYFSTYSEQPFEELKRGVLKGLVGVSSSPNNIAEWFVSRDCLIVMDYDRFMSINETETINYYDPYQLMKNNLYLFRRLYANVSRYGEQDDAVIQTLIKILEKIVPEINLEINVSQGQKYTELYRISRFLNPYQTKAFPNWIEQNQTKIENPIDLTNAILDFNKLNDSYLGSGFENPVLTFDELLPIVEKGITNASSIYDSEQEIVLINRQLNIPKNSQLFFIQSETESNKNELIEKYNLREIYKIYFVETKEIEKYRNIWLKKEKEKFNNKLEQGREDLELKKEQVVQELLDYFLEKSISYVKNELEKESLEYYESLDYYDETDDDSIEQNLFSIPLVESIMNTYVLIVKNFWKAFIQKKQVENLDLYAFDMFYFNVKQELKNYFENNKDELEKLYNYRNTRGSVLLDPYRFEWLMLKTIDDYENLPELIDYKELAKMYLDKMGREIYRYYDKKDLPLISQYKDGGETDEPNEFWGTEAGGVLIYCRKTERYLLLERSKYVNEPYTWNLISGKIEEDEAVKDAVIRECFEEIYFHISDLIPIYKYEKYDFIFHNFLSVVDDEFHVDFNWESADYGWFHIEDFPKKLHFGLKILLESVNLIDIVNSTKEYYQKRNIGGGIEYYKRKGIEHWVFTSKKDFEQNSQEDNTIEF